jgi:hypothetical protein
VLLVVAVSVSVFFLNLKNPDYKRDLARFRKMESDWKKSWVCLRCEHTWVPR